MLKKHLQKYIVCSTVHAKRELLHSQYSMKTISGLGKESRNRFARADLRDVHQSGLAVHQFIS